MMYYLLTQTKASVIKIISFATCFLLMDCGGFAIESISHFESICNSIVKKEVMEMYQKLSELMVRTGETAYQVAKKTGISQTAFSNWKAGVSNPGTKSLKALAKHFNVPIEYFLQDNQST